jgi:hypothetical protein
MTMLKDILREESTERLDWLMGMGCSDGCKEEFKSFCIGCMAHELYMERTAHEYTIYRDIEERGNSFIIYKGDRVFYGPCLSDDPILIRLFNAGVELKEGIDNRQ